ncbi:MAG: hypothetical protein NTW11_00155 [Candidatus Staskawiczbacteria bacterium]|nr:hypothetical protein [Candidatus Staskawiczbacteria bacterium]
MNKKTALVTTFVSLSSLAVSSVALATAAVCPPGQICNPLSSNTFGELLTTSILPAVSAAVASIAVLMLVISGILFLISAGDPQKLQTAKTALTYAIIGLAVALAAELILELIKKVLGI